MLIKYMLLKTAGVTIKTLEFQVKGAIFRFQCYQVYVIEGYKTYT